MPTIAETIAYIKDLHEVQTTKVGEPYWTHPVAVRDLLPPEATEDEHHAALLHDVIEDCGVAEDDLKARGYSDRVILLVVGLTRPSGAGRPTCMDWIRQIAASGDAGLIRIKIADNVHNSLPERVARLPPDERGIVARYERSLAILRPALAALESKPWMQQAVNMIDADKLDAWSIAKALCDEYERGKRHGADDRWLIERHNREQAREIEQWKRDAAESNLAAAKATQCLRAIVARIDGDYDNRWLMQRGPLGDRIDDIKRFAVDAITEVAETNGAWS